MNHQQQPNMKYWIFDLAVALALAASVLTVAGRGSFGFASGDSRPPPSVSGGVSGVTSGGDADAPPTHSGHCVDGAEPPLPKFNVGDIVEVYDPKIHPNYAFHAKIENVFVDKHENDRCSSGVDSVRYDVRPGFGPIATYERLEASSIRPMAPFEPHSQAMCDEGRMLNSRIVPCTVDSFVPNSKNFFGRNGPEHPWLYSISFLEAEGGSGELIKKMNMPVTRIRRIIVQEPLSQEGEGIRWGTRAAPATRMTREDPPAEKIPAAAPVIPQEPTSDHEEDSSRRSGDTFPVGSIIEIYGPGGYFAFPATVTGVKHGMNEQRTLLARYDLTHGITRAALKNVEPQFVHPYEIYREGQTASCNVGKQRKIIMVPCTVMSAVNDNEARGDNVVYQVRAKMVDRDDERVIFLPRLRVQRHIEERMK